MTMLALYDITVVETDEVTHELWPEWFTNRTFASADPTVRIAHDRRVGRATASAFMRASKRNPGNVLILTNMWGGHFRAELREAGILNGDMLPLGVFRSSPAEINAVSHRRGGGEIATSLAASWVDAWAHFGSTTFTELCWIPRAETGRPTFLSDVLDFNGFGTDLLAEMRP